MGKYVIQYIIPIMIAASAAIYLVREWYVRRYHKRIERHNQIELASRKYEATIIPIKRAPSRKSTIKQKDTTK